MSKAFTRESDDALPELPQRRPGPLPPGVKNLITADGAERFRSELEELTVGGTSQEQKTTQRIAWLKSVLQSAEIVPAAQDTEVVRFGASVLVRHQTPGEPLDEKFRIVGIDEVDLDRNWISWRSPLAKALLNRRNGEQVSFRAPSGEQKLEILAIEL